MRTEWSNGDHLKAIEEAFEVGAELLRACVVTGLGAAVSGACIVAAVTGGMSLGGAAAGPTGSIAGVVVGSLIGLTATGGAFILTARYFALPTEDRRRVGQMGSRLWNIVTIWAVARGFRPKPAAAG